VRTARSRVEEPAYREGTGQIVGHDAVLRNFLDTGLIQAGRGYSERAFLCAKSPVGPP